MTIRITGPKRQVPRRGAVRTLLVVAIILSIFLILLELTAGFLVDWLWFSAIGYFGVFWTTIVAEAEVFFAVFVATAIILWVNVSVRRVLESYESVVIQGWWPDSRRVTDVDEQEPRTLRP